MKGKHKIHNSPGIRMKFIAVFIPFVALISVFIYIYLPHQLENQAIRFIADKARSMIDVAAFNISSTLVFEDKNDMENILHSMEHVADIVYLVVQKESGQVFGAFNLSEAEKAGYRFPVNQDPVTGDGLVYRVMTPITFKAKKIGELFLGISLKNLRLQVERSKKTVAVVSAIIFVAGVLAVFFISVLSTWPLKKMVRIIEDISRGDLSRRVPLTSGDEVGKLAAAFNAMVGNLEAFSRELRELNVNLENKVLERTRELQVEVNERKSAQEALEESEKKYKHLVDNSLVGIYITQDQVIRFCNQKFVDIFGYGTSEEVLEKSILDLLTPESRIYIERGGKPGTPGTSGERVAHHCELEGIKKDGTIFALELLDTPINFRDQPAVQGILMDITVRKQIEEDRKKLEHQLRQSQKMESLGTMAGGIAHDFNNILSAIIGYTELTLIRTPGGSKEYSNLERVLAASSRARELVKQILAFSRKSEKERRPIWFGEAVKEALTLMRSILPSSIEIHQEIPEMSRPVMADWAETHQVVMNLCNNAGHAMRKKGGTLRVTLKEIHYEAGSISRTHLTPGWYQQLTISDTGHGMSQEILNRIFEPYFTTKREGEGTGMGLAVVHGIVKSFGGEISVYSEPEKGSTFHIFLPSVKEEEEVKANIQESILVPRGNERILFIDDEPVLAELGKSVLESLGYQVEMRSSSIEALEIFRENPDRFDVIVSDQTMPNMTGVELAAEFRAIKPTIPIILCSGFSEFVNEENYRAYGIQAFLLKPILKREIATVIRDVLERRS